MVMRLVGLAARLALAAARYGKANTLHNPVAAMYKKDGEEKYVSFVIVNEKELGPGPTLVLMGDLDEEDAAKIEKAIMIGLELGFKALLEGAGDGRVQIIEDRTTDRMKEVPEGLEGVVTVAKGMGVLYTDEYFKEGLAKYFKKRTGINYYEEEEGVIPRVAAGKFRGGDYFLRWKVYEGLIRKRWNEYVAPVEGISKAWVRVFVISEPKMAEIAKQLYESLYVIPDKKTRKKLWGELEKYIKTVIKSST